jgi:Phosphotransferase enzyme family
MSFEQHTILMRPGYEEIIGKIRQGAHLYFSAGSIVRVRPFASIKRPSSDILKVELEFKHSKINVVIKLFKLKSDAPHHATKTMERVRRDFETTKFFYDQLRRFPGYSTVRPVVCFPDSLATVTEESPGQNFRDLIVQKAKWYPRRLTLEELAGHCYRSGKWLQIFQGISRANLNGRLRPDDLLDDVDHRLKRLLTQPRSGFSSQLRRQILNYLENQVALVNDSELDLAGIHADFSPSNIVINGNEIVVLDFATYRTGSIYQDLTYFARYLENFLHKPVFRPKTIAMLQEAFFNGYGENVDPTSSICKIFKIRHVVCHLVGILDPAGCPLHERLFNGRIARRYIRWLEEVTRKGGERESFWRLGGTEQWHNC